MNESTKRAIRNSPSIILGNIKMTCLVEDNDDGVSGETLLMSPHGRLYHHTFYCDVASRFHHLKPINQAEALELQQELISSSWRTWPKHAPTINTCYVDRLAVDAFDDCVRQLLSGEKEVKFPFPPDTEDWEVDCKDLRASHELAQAALDLGIPHIAMETTDNGRHRVILRCALPEAVEVFMREWAPAQGLVDIYGDPDRGFAGGYLPYDKT